MGDSQKLAVLCAQLSDDKLAKDTVVVDLSSVESSPCDYFVLCSCESTQQVNAITNLILDECVKYRLVKPKIEGQEENEWVLMDFFDVVVHIMMKKNREYYKIEKLWGDGEFYRVDNDGDMTQIETEEILQIYAAEV